MTKVTGNYLIAGKQLVPVAEFDDYVVDQNDTIYEVLRVIHFKPLFIGEHVDRLIRSMMLKKINISDSRAQIIQNIKRLIENNDLPDGNIRFQFNNNDIRQFCAWYVPAYYPTDKQYREGVPVMTFSAARQNPNIKTRDIELRQEADEFIRQQGIYEAILVNNDGYLTEGSRSNIFFIEGDIFVTPPLSFVLPGVTRQKIIELIRNNQLKVKEEIIRQEELKHFSSCFITSTSAKVLPVSSVNGIITDVNNDWVKKISEQYNQLINDYLERFNWSDI
jgi:branched-chain amino acid aminotransferase